MPEVLSGEVFKIEYESDSAVGLQVVIHHCPAREAGAWCSVEVCTGTQTEQSCGFLLLARSKGENCEDDVKGVFALAFIAVLSLNFSAGQR